MENKFQLKPGDRASIDFAEEERKRVDDEGKVLHEKDFLITSQLIAEATADGTESSIVFENLDLLEDGETYDFEVACGKASPNIWLKMGDSSDAGYGQFGQSGNWGSVSYYGTSARAVQGVLVGNVYNGPMLIVGTIKQHSNSKISVIATSSSGNSGGVSSVRQLTTCGYINVYSNVNRIEFLAEGNTYKTSSTFTAETKIRIFKRATNSPARS